MKFKYLLIIIGVLAIIGFLIHKSNTEHVSMKSSADSIAILNEPLQQPIENVIIPPVQIGKNRYYFDVRASYKISGLLVSKKRYLRDYMSKLSPYDYAIIWGKTPEFLPYLKFAQTYRYALYNYKLSAQVDNKYVQAHMSNNHLIPSNINIRRAFSKADKKDLVEVDGYLVNVIAQSKRKGISNWNTSLRRDDTGGGACEIIYVTKLRINDRIFE